MAGLFTPTSGLTTGIDLSGDLSRYIPLMNGAGDTNFLVNRLFGPVRYDPTGQEVLPNSINVGGNQISDPRYSQDLGRRLLAQSEAESRSLFGLGSPGFVAALMMGGLAAGGAFGGASGAASGGNALSEVTLPSSAVPIGTGTSIDALAGTGLASLPSGLGGAAAAAGGGLLSGLGALGGQSVSGGLLSTLGGPSGLAGLLLGGLGAYSQAGAISDAADAAARAAQFRPFNVSGPFGSVNFGDQSVSAAPGADGAAQRDLLSQLVLGRLGGQSPTSGFQNFANQLGNQSIPGLFNDALSASSSVPTDAFNSYQGLLSQLTGTATNQANSLFGQAGVNPNAGLASMLSNSGINSALGAINGLGGAQFDPSAANGLIGQALGATNLSGANGLINQSLGALDTSQFQNLLGRAGSFDLSQARNLLGQSQSALNPSIGNSFLNQASQAANVNFDPTQMVNDRLNLLREQAAPQEDRAFNSLQQRLFNQGRLGSTGGSRDMEAFARGLGQADLSRQLAAQDLGMAATQQAANIGLNQAGLFSNLAGQSFGNAANTAGILQGLAGTSANMDLNGAGLLSNLAGQSLSGALGTSGALQGLAGLQGQLGLSQAGQIGNLAGLAGNLAGNAANFDLSRLSQMGALGQGLVNQAQGYNGLDLNRSLGMLGIAPSLLGMAGNLGGNAFNAATGFSDLTNARAQQRLANAQALFGFGSDLGVQDFNQALSALQGQQSIDTALRNLIALGGNIGGQQASAGGNQAQALLQGAGSPLGGFLSGLGVNLLGAAINNQ